jgi:hypothetical protein
MNLGALWSPHKHVQRALDVALSRLVDELHRTREPWMRGRHQSIYDLEKGLGKSLPRPRRQLWHFQANHGYLIEYGCNPR